jgi:hypothetical protein
MKEMILILDNRNEKQGLEICEGYGNWYVYNTDNDKLVACKYKYEANEIKRNPQDWDI